ncbi:MAG: hypothetical protein J6B87_04925 [Clostridia bacterium]|nr:hypothetical protein [Clostridia bacterium]
MKGFVRVVVTLLVLGIIAGTVYYAVVVHGNRNLINETNKSENNLTFNENSNVIDIITNGNKELENISQNQDTVIKFEHTQCVTMNMGIELLGSSINDLLVAFETTEIPVMFQKVVNNDGTKIVIVPMSDFVDTQEFVYDTEGKLISYTTISNTVGGNVQYIFSDNILTQTINNMEEFVVPVFEEQDEILARATKLYNL